MTTFDRAITRAETDLAQVQSALDTAQQVLEVADRAHSVGRRLVRMIRVVAIVFAIGGVLVAVVVLFDRLWRGPENRVTRPQRLPAQAPCRGPRASRSRRMRALTTSRTNCSPAQVSANVPASGGAKFCSPDGAEKS